MVSVNCELPRQLPPVQTSGVFHAAAMLCFRVSQKIATEWRSSYHVFERSG